MVDWLLGTLNEVFIHAEWKIAFIILIPKDNKIEGSNSYRLLCLLELP